MFLLRLRTVQKPVHIDDPRTPETDQLCIATEKKKNTALFQIWI